MPENILFWLRNDFTYFGVAQKLKNNLNCNLFAIVDGQESLANFYNSQKFLKFEKIWNYYEIVKPVHQKLNLNYLTEFEKKYNLSLLKYINNEPIFGKSNPFHKFSTNEIFSIIQNECELFESIIKESNPSFIVAKDSWFFETEWEPIHHFQLFYDFCLANKIKVLLLNQPHIANKSIISEHNHAVDYLTSLKKIENFENSKDLKTYVKNNDLSIQNKKYVKRNKLSIFKKISKFSKGKPSFQYFMKGRTKNSLFWYFLKYTFIKISRKSFIDKNFEQKIDLNKKFIYFPLSVEDEKEILFSAPLFTNQIEIVRHIARSLPMGLTLYVKEHPNQENHNWRSKSFYKELMNLPNVHLIHPSVSKDILFQNCSLVITISGTSGFESIFYKKPSILFSELGYSILSSVNVIKSPEDLTYIIKKSLMNKVDEIELSKYISELEKNCFNFDSHTFFDFQQKYFSNTDLEDDLQFSTQMVYYLKSNSEIFEKLSLEFQKKILQHLGKKNNNETI